MIGSDDTTSMDRCWRICVAVTLTVVFGLLSLPPLIFGLYLLFCLFRMHTAAVYYVEYPYLLAALIWTTVGAVCFFSTLFGAWRRSFYGLLFCLPLVIGLGSLVTIPDAKPHLRSMTTDANYLSSVNSFFRVWYEANHRFPANEPEFRDALMKGPAAWQYRVQSPPSISHYSRNGERLRYEIVVVANANGPRIDNPSERPGVIYYCVSANQQEFWVTMTTLQNDVEPAASLKRLALRWDGTVWVVAAAGKDYPTHKQ
jgi:hypothetical protein